MILDSHEILLNFVFHFPFGNLIFAPIYCCTVLQTFRWLHEQDFFYFGKKCDSASDKPNAAVNNFVLHAVHT
jgi:hypothetical protein